MAGEDDHENADPPGVHVMRRGTSRQAATLVRAIIANHDDQPQTAHDVAARTKPEHLPALVKRLAVQRRVSALHGRRATYQQWREETQQLVAQHERWIDQITSRDRAKEHTL